MLQDAPEATRVVHNCIDINRFHYIEERERPLLRRRLGFGENEVVLVAGAANNSALRKGFHYIQKAIKHLEKTVRLNKNKFSYASCYLR